MNEDDKTLALSIPLGVSCVCGTAHEGSICDKHQQIIAALATARREARAAAFSDALAAVPEVGVTFPNGNEEFISAPYFRDDVIKAIEAAANTEEGAGNASKT